MTTHIFVALAAGTGAVLTGGIYAAFPIMVLPALDRLGPERATAAMRAINVAAERPPFLGLFFGTAVASTVVLVSGALDSARPVPAGQLVGAGLTIAAFLLTVAVNVPLNRRLAGAIEATAWDSYRRRWGAANGVRAVVSIAGGVMLLAGSSGAPGGA